METIDIAWLAGILEGEGSFYFRMPRNRMTGYPVISIQTSDIDVALKVRNILGTTNIYKLSPRRTNGNSEKKIMYSTQLSSPAKTIGWMMTLFTFMSYRRRDEIRICIRNWKESISQRGKHKNRLKKLAITHG